MPDTRVIGVDVGGTKILAGIVDGEGRIERRHERPTPTSSQDELLAGLNAAVDELREDGVAAIGLGVPSPLVGGRVVGSVNIPLQDIDLRATMSDRFGLPVAVDNDANVAALAEQRAGAGRGARTMVMLTLGTGVGGGAVIDGTLYRGWAEFGHIVIEYGGLPCPGTCPGRGHLEAYASGTAATLLAKETFGPDVDAHGLVRMAAEGDERARWLLADIGKRLGAGIASLVHIFLPDVVVIGGGFAAAGDFILEPARDLVRRETLPPAGEIVRIVRAELLTDAGLIGAGLLAVDAL